jgi:hypothetical protein
MPKVTQYQPDQVQSKVVSQPTAQAAPAGLFNTDISDAISDVAKVGADIKNRVDTTSAEEALVGFERDYNDILHNSENAYFNTNGRNAYDGADDVNKSIDALKTKYGESLNQQSRYMFDGVADKHITRSRKDVSKHASTGLNTWEIAVINSQVEDSIDNAVNHWADPERLNTDMAAGIFALTESAEITGLTGKPLQETLDNYRSSFASNAINAATASSAAAGEELFAKMDRFVDGTDKLKIQKTIDDKKDSEKVVADSNYVVTTASGLVNKYDSLAEAMKDQKVESLKNTDPELYRGLRSEATSQFRLQDVAKSDAEAANYDTAIGYVNRNMTVAQIQSADIDTWKGMSNLQRNNIASGKHQVTDQTVYNNLISLKTSELANVIPSNYAADLNPNDLTMLTKLVNKAKEGRSGSRVITLSKKVNSAAKDAYSGAWELRNGSRSQTGEDANGFMNDVQGAISEWETINDRDITPLEEDRIIGEFTSAVVIERSRFGLDILAGDDSFDLSNTPPNDLRMLNQILKKTAGIDKTKLTDAYQSLIENDQPVTVMTLFDLYEGSK